jgi:hypothetical protein
LEVVVDAVEVRPTGVFDGHHPVGGGVRRSDELVQLELRGPVVVVLRVLQQHDHEERHEGDAGGDQQLPPARVAGEGAEDQPRGHDTDDDHRARDRSGP